MKYKTRTLILATSLSLSALMLTACHESPLKSHSARENIVALQEAARVAEEGLGLSSDNRGRTYLNCMKGKAVEVNCEAFFEQMLGALKKKQGYSDMTLSDLTNKTSFASLADGYEDKLFNTID